MSFQPSVSGVYALAVVYNTSTPSVAAVEVVYASNFALHIKAGSPDAAGTTRNSLQDLAPGWYGGDDLAFVDGLVYNRMERLAASNRFAVAAGDRFGNRITVGGNAGAVAVSVVSERGGHTGTSNVSDLGGGMYGIAFETTRAGWYSVSVRVDEQHIVSSPFRLFVQAGVGESAARSDTRLCL